jgi:hypothetical protein
MQSPKPFAADIESGLLPSCLIKLKERRSQAVFPYMQLLAF